MSKKSAGRPSLYSETLAQKICHRLSDGESLRSICKDEDMPTAKTVVGWALDQKHPFCEQYAIARRIQAELMIDEIRSIADDSTQDYVLGPKGLQPDTEHINRSRLRVDTRKWIACKVLPKIYGDKLQTEHSGSLNLESLVTGSIQPKEKDS